MKLGELLNSFSVFSDTPITNDSSPQHDENMSAQEHLSGIEPMLTHQPLRSKETMIDMLYQFQKAGYAVFLDHSSIEIIHSGEASRQTNLKDDEIVDQMISFPYDIDLRIRSHIKKSPHIFHTSDTRPMYHLGYLSGVAKQDLEKELSNINTGTRKQCHLTFSEDSPMGINDLTKMICAVINGSTCNPKYKAQLFRLLEDEMKKKILARTVVDAFAQQLFDYAKKLNNDAKRYSAFSQALLDTHLLTGNEESDNRSIILNTLGEKIQEFVANEQQKTTQIATDRELALRILSLSHSTGRAELTQWLSFMAEFPDFIDTKFRLKEKALSNDPDALKKQYFLFYDATVLLQFAHKDIKGVDPNNLLVEREKSCFQ